MSNESQSICTAVVNLASSRDASCVVMRSQDYLGLQPNRVEEEEFAFYVTCRWIALHFGRIAANSAYMLLKSM